ncbi:MAG: hypothetical protein AABY13_01570, partial [Nanoarchaeota archaeon]
VQRMREACEAQPPLVLIVVFERDEASIALMRRNGYQVLAHLTGSVEKKRMVEKQGVKFFDHLAGVVHDYDVRYQPKAIVLGSPAFWKDEFIKSVSDPVLRKKFVLATTSGGHEQAIGEVLRRDEVRSALVQDRVAKESHAVEQVLAGIAKGSAVAYGLRDVQAAADAGAIALLLVTEHRLAQARADKTFFAFDAVLRGVAEGKGDIVIVGAHDAGKRLDGLGGIAALLRYRLQ